MHQAFTLFVIAGLAQQVPGLTQTHLELELTLDYETGSLEGTASLTVRNEGVRAESSVPLHLGRLMTASAARTAGGDTLRFTQDVIRLEDWPEFQLNQVFVYLSTPLAAGREAVVTLDYSGVLVPYTETGMSYVRDHIAPDFTILRSEAMAFPVLGLPSQTESSAMPRSDFTVAARITAPQEQVVATGFDAITVQSSGNARVWTFESPEPIPFLNMTVSPYEELSNERVRILHFPQDAEGARRLETAVGEATVLYESWFGANPSTGRITVMEIPEGWGSQAHRVAGIIQTADAFRSDAQMTQLYHELAHLWHPPDREVPAPRWNEGLATFLQYRVAETLGDPGSLDARMEDISARAVRSAAGNPAALAELGRLDITDRAYSTGAVFFYLLFRIMGAPAFDDALSDWMVRYRVDGSTSEGLSQSFLSDDESIRRVFADWMDSAEWYERVTGLATLSELVDYYLGIAP